MGSAGGSESVTTRVVRPGAGGVVARPELLQRLGAAARVTVVSAPAGSGKTVLLRSWISAAGLTDSTAWVPVERDERDPQRFWLSVLDALRRTSAGSGLVRELTPAPDLDAVARDALGDPVAAGHALESAFDAAEPDHILLPFLIYLAPGLLERHARGSAKHAALAAEILRLLPAERGGPPLAGPQGSGETGPRSGPRSGEVASRHERGNLGESPPWLMDPLSQSEIRVLRYLPTHLSRQEIADELYVSANTVKTHMRHLYAKLGTHRRAEAVKRARALGLLAPSPRMPNEGQRDAQPTAERQ